tara:strand:+ start:906 stop:1295 length:390 start_codon:yes stop_codon:yes gene_type:complete
MFDIDNLTEEEKSLLDKITSKMEDGLEQFKKDNIEEMAKQCEDPNLFQPKPIESITNYPREIVIKVNAEISTVSDANKLLEIDNVVENYYHIPIPSGIDYTDKIDDFMNKFDTEVGELVIKIKTDGTAK